MALMKAWILLSISFLALNLAHAQIDPRASAREELNVGVEAYKSAHFDDAIEHFKRAALLDPEMKNAHLYLATAYAQMYVPEVETPENIANAKNALEQYRLVQRMDPNDITAAKSIASINRELKKLPEARDAYKRAAQIDPTDAEAFYGAGVVDFTMVYPDIANAKKKLEGSSQAAEEDDGNDDSDDDKATEKPQPKSNSDPEYAIIFSPLCVPLRTRHLSDVDDGIAMLIRAIDLRKNYDDAMVYLNLLLRQRADLECGDRAAHEADIKKANDWTDQAMAARKKRVEEATKKSQAPADSPPR
jgi:tetratricopeptide (TPR) repeat protein